MPSIPDPEDRRGVPAWKRALVWLFLSAFAFCALAEVEAWPFTGWRLFSELRRERSVSLRAVIVAADSTEVAFPFGALPPTYRWGQNVLPTLPSRPIAEQVAVCDAWAAAGRAGGLDVAAIRIYRVVRIVSDRDGRRGADPGRGTLLLSCGNGSVTPAAQHG